MKKVDLNKIYNCILAGAVGDALGEPIRDMGYDVIIEEYGKNGYTDLKVDSDDKARITANTQLTIFTIDALIRAYTKYYIYGITGLGRVISYTSYLRWQYTQNRDIPSNIEKTMLEDNYLMEYQELKYERYAEESMKQVLENKLIDEEDIGYIDNKGYSCLTKSAPIGLVFYNNDKIAFEMAVKVAKITHGHPSAYLSCGVFAVIIANLARGEKLEKAIEKALKMVIRKEEASELIEKIRLGLELSKDNIHYAEKLDDFGFCDDAHEVLGAAIYIALTFQDNISDALLYAVNNNCYGSNIASVVGNILGLYRGIDIRVAEWSKKVELYDLYKTLAFDLSLVIKKELPKEIDNFDKDLTVDQIKYVNEQNIANWWLIKYDKD